MHDPIFDIFRDEAIEHLRMLERGFLDLDATSNPRERSGLVDSLFRHAHNLKGDSRALNLISLQQSAAVLEETLQQLREDPAQIKQEAIEQGLHQLDILRESFNTWRNKEFQDSSSHPGPADKPEPAATEDATDPHKGATAAPWLDEAQSIRLPAERLDRMLNLVGEVRVLQRANGEMQQQLRTLRTHLDEISRRLQGEFRPALENYASQTRQIETRLQQHLTREQLLTQSLEEDISQARLLPLTMLADALRRPIRDLARSLSKDIRYQADVGNILLDKTVIESLRAPVLHLIRNAADHGIELPEERRRRGKPAQGVISLRAGRQGEKVLLQISDDGAGPDYERIRQRLLAQGLLPAAEIQELSPQSLLQWLFHPGFSTASVGDISGRGVGLDVVRDSVQRIQGRIEIEAQPGAGTTFSLILPVTLSTIHVLTVSCLGQYLGLPSSCVLRTGRVKVSDLREVNGMLVLLLDGEPLRWVTLADFLGLGRPRTQIHHDFENYVIVQQHNRRFALRVDFIEEEREVLLKPLNFPLAGMPGILGGTIRPDGSVQLVLEMSLDLPERATVATQQGSPIRSVAKAPRILVVDDSPTTRAIMRNVLTAAGYLVQTAVDGMDAMNQIREQRPDLIVSDFDMPRLNGVDLTRQVKARWNLPVILVTGREQEHHRREGLEAGADAYVIKSSFQGEGLLKVIRQLVIDERRS